jgi:hypothetical protein
MSPHDQTVRFYNDDTSLTDSVATASSMRR